MINRIQQGTSNNYKPAFGDRLVFLRNKRYTFVKEFGEHVNNSPLKDYGVAPYYKLLDGSFHANKFVRRVKSLFKDATLGLNRTFVVEDVSKLENTGDIFLKIRPKGSTSEKDIVLLDAKSLLTPTTQKTKGGFYSKPKLDPSEPSIKILTDMAAV